MAQASWTSAIPRSRQPGPVPFGSAAPKLDTVQLDTTYEAHFADAPTPLANYRSLLELMERSALPQGESQDFIRSIAQDL
jgi:hypothetical protein